MDRSSWVTRTYKTGDERGYVALMNLIFPRYRCDRRRWQWEFRDDPFGSLQVFSDSNGQIVGHMGLIYVPIKIGELIVQGSQAVDLAVHPDFRGKGMFLEVGRKMVQEAENEGAIISYGVPNEPAYQGHLKYGWFFVSDIPTLTRPMNKRAFILFTLAKLRSLVHQLDLKSTLKFRSLFRDLIKGLTINHYKRTLTSITFTKHLVTRFGEKFDRLWEEASVQHQILVVRKARYLNWRFIQKPYSNYTILAAERNNAVQGYVVLATEVQGFQGWKKGYIVDIFAKSEEAIDYLVTLALDFFRTKSVDLATCWMLEHQPAYSLLVRRGFIKDVLISQKLICRINTSDNAFETLYRGVEKGWFFTMGDSDNI